MESTIPVLLVEDDEGDVFLVQEAVRQGGLAMILSVARDGEEALDFLHKTGRYAQAERPRLILLDLNMPRRSGKEVLSEIKSDAALRAIPVVIFTSSQAERDVKDCYDLHANCYILKPMRLNDFTQTLRSIADFWFRVSMLPR